MASITAYKDGYRAQVAIKGVRESKVFRTKREATAWASARETEIRSDAEKLPGEKFTLGDALRRYSETVSIRKDGRVKEQIRLVALERMLPSDKPIAQITPEVIAEWRDNRIKLVRAASVIRDFSLLSHVFETARREWRWIKENPFSDVRRPDTQDHREVVITRQQIRLMLKSLGYHRGPVRSVIHAVACCFLLALRTGMRAGEICNLTWSLVFDDYATVGVIAGGRKTGKRDVPLTHQAIRVINQLRGFDETYVAGVRTASLDALFRKYRGRAGLEGFTFHDTRHTAATWIAQKLHILDLCKMFGWKNPKRAMVYYNPTASDISKRLSARIAPGQSVQSGSSRTRLE